MNDPEKTSKKVLYNSSCFKSSANFQNNSRNTSRFLHLQYYFPESTLRKFNSTVQKKWSMKHQNLKLWVIPILYCLLIQLISLNFSFRKPMRILNPSWRIVNKMNLIVLSSSLKEALTVQTITVLQKANIPIHQTQTNPSIQSKRMLFQPRLSKIRIRNHKYPVMIKLFKRLKAPINSFKTILTNNWVRSGRFWKILFNISW